MKAIALFLAEWRSPSSQTDWVGTMNIMTQITDTGADHKVVPVEVIEPLGLSEEEQRLRLHLERVVERSFYEAGKALKQLRDQKLYRSSYLLLNFK